MFHAHLVGLYRWDEVEFDPTERRPKIAKAALSRQERRLLRDDGAEGKFVQRVCMRFGIWEISIESPSEHPPLGRVVLDGDGRIEGPLDPATWDRIGGHIKQKTEELKDGEGTATGIQWG